jgi:hypothetical protein
MYVDVTYMHWCISYLRCVIYVCDHVAYVLECRAYCRFHTYMDGCVTYVPECIAYVLCAFPMYLSIDL